MRLLVDCVTLAACAVIAPFVRTIGTARAEPSYFTRASRINSSTGVMVDAATPGASTAPSGAEDDDFDIVNAEEVDGVEDTTADEEDDALPDLDEDDDDYSENERQEVARKERERLRKQDQLKRQRLDEIRQQQNASAANCEEAVKANRLQFLLKQAEVFQHFAGTSLQKKKKRDRHDRSGEEDEDAELLADEETEGETTRGHRLSVQPSVIKFGQMREYQLQGLNWLIHLYDNGINGILADEMGLGKTLQTISLLGYLLEFRGIRGPHMVIVPKSTLHNWLNEFRRWCPCLRAVKFHGNAEQREHQKSELLQPGKYDAMITSYEMVIKEKNFFKKTYWRYIIIDEAHRIKNENSILSRTVRMFKTSYRLLITGTPLQNNLHELWALLNFLLPEVFSSAEKFDEWFGTGAGGNEAEVVQQLHKVLRPFLLRRVKSDVEKSLPPKKETILKIGMSEMQQTWYKKLLQKDISTLTGGADRSKLLNIVMQLRKCCNHPYLFQGAEPGPPYITGDHLVENSGKMVLLDKLLPKLRERESRVLIFSQMTRMLDILEDYMHYRGFLYCRIDGNTSGEDRENMIDSFNAENSEKFVFLLSTRAGGLGINLATADIVVLYDSDWNPQMDLQAMDRAHRIGQKKPVQVFRFCTEHAIEEKVIEKAYKKLRLDALVIQQGRLTQNASKVGKDDLLSMVKYGAEKVFSSEPAKITDEDIDLIISKGESDTAALNEKMAEFTASAKQFTMDGGIVYDFKDEDDYRTAKKDLSHLKKAMASNWVEQPRQRKTRINYNEADFIKASAKTAKQEERQKGPRLAKMPQLNDFQFFDTKRIEELYNIEHSHEMWKYNQTHRRHELEKANVTPEEIDAQLAADESFARPLTEEEQLERDRLLTENPFKDWMRRDFNAFLRACEKHGRENIDAIAKEVESKSEEEVKAYAEVFFKRYQELHDYERYIKQIERGEQKIQRQQGIMKAIQAKMGRYRNPWLELKIQYGANKNKAYTEEEDRFLVCMMHKLGYGAWDEMKAEIRKSWRFRFDWFFKSRTPVELNRRCDTLIRLIDKENEEADAKRGTNGRKSEGGSGKKRKASEGGAVPAAKKAAK